MRRNCQVFGSVMEVAATPSAACDTSSSHNVPTIGSCTVQKVFNPSDHFAVSVVRRRSKNAECIEKQ